MGRSLYLHAVNEHVGRRIRARRLQMGMSQQALAEQVGVTFQQIQKYESGANSLSAATLYRLARVLEARPGHFFEGLSV
jgi:transcriptional regulator with XRE-family HTH domain